jgi:magnesium transporter
MYDMVLKMNVQGIFCPVFVATQAYFLIVSVLYAHLRYLFSVRVLMKTILHFGNVDWIHLASPQKQEITDIVQQYDFHELIEEDLFELTNQEKIDVYEDVIFIVLNFPKYDTKIKKYFLNEFSIILTKNRILTMTKYDTNHIKMIIDDYKQELSEREEDEDFKISPYYILYKLLDTMYDKSIRDLNKSTKDVNVMEDQLFVNSSLEKKLLEDLTIKKRNIVFLKHAFLPHGEILEELQKIIPKFYKEDLEVYFEDLVSKYDKIMNTVHISFENVESLGETYNTLMNIKTNSVINVLTLFSATT